MQAEPSGKVITFYSYKGGTGRSLTLANVAWILASNGKRVLVIDWDLEAPGLHRYFSPFLVDRDLTTTEGLIDFVIEFATEAMTPPAEGEAEDPKWYLKHADILRYAVSLDWEFKDGTLDFICAGRQDSSYSTRVNTFDWRSFYDRHGGGVFLNAAKQQMLAEYDYILIDSRTGVSDTSGICTVQFPDALVVCFTLNNQSIDGAANVVASVLEQRRSLEQQTGVARPKIFPVPMRVELAEKDKLKTRRKYARRRFALFPDHLGVVECEAYWNEIEVLYVPYYAYEEVLSTFGDEPGMTASMLGSIERLTGHLSDGAVTRAALLSDDERAAVIARYARRGAAEIEQSELDAAAEAVLVELSGEDQLAARRLFTSLVRVAPQAEGGKVTGLRLPLSRLDFARDTVRRFATADLLKLGRDQSGEETVELATEALIDRWARFKQWIDSDREFLLWRQQLRVFMADWRANREDERSLLMGSSLETARTWLRQRAADIAADEASFIAESEASQSSQLRKQAVLEEAARAAPVPSASRRYGVPAALAGFAIVAAIAFLYPRGDRDLPAASAPPAPQKNFRQEQTTTAFEFVRLADDELQRGNPATAVELYSKALALVPDPLWLVQRGIAYDQSGEAEKAKADYDRAIAGNPELVDAYVNRAANRITAKDYAAALADYDQVIRLDPNRSEAYFNRAVTHDAAGMREAAIQDYTQAIQLRPDYANAYFNRGLDYASLEKKDLAAADFKNILGLNADAQTLTAADAQLEKLGISQSAAAPPAKPTVYLHYQDERDGEQIKEIGAALLNTGRYEAARPEWLPVRSSGDVRYYFKFDEQAARDVKQLIEQMLAKRGLPVNLALRAMDPENVDKTGNAKARPGTIEAWLPSLSQRIPIQRSNALQSPAQVSREYPRRGEAKE